MKIPAQVIYILFSIFLLLYVSLPSPNYPNPPTDALRSSEPGDTEDELRRAYFTNYSREEVQAHYKKQFMSGFPDFLTYKLIHPPEEAFSVIRDQTRSTHLVEYVHPMRESLYLNEFVAQTDKDEILIEGRVWHQKITVRYVPSDPIYRFVVTLLTIVMTYFVSTGAIKTLLSAVKATITWKHR